MKYVAATAVLLASMAAAEAQVSVKTRSNDNKAVLVIRSGKVVSASRHARPEMFKHAGLSCGHADRRRFAWNPDRNYLRMLRSDRGYSRRICQVHFLSETSQQI
jgi:hypothetical protein